MNIKNIFCILSVSLISNIISAQLLANFGQTIYTGNDALIKIEGSVLNDISGTIEHNGLISIESSPI